MSRGKQFLKPGICFAHQFQTPNHGFQLIFFQQVRYYLESFIADTPELFYLPLTGFSQFADHGSTVAGVRNPVH